MEAENWWMGSDFIAASRIVVVMPNWLGDGVMATPFLRALRGIYPEAHIAAVARPLVAPVLAGDDGDKTTKTPRHQDFVDEVKMYEKGAEGAVVRWMREGRFELGVLLPNSFRSAWMMWRGGVKRRLGYARGGRSLLLTDRVKAALKGAEQKRKDNEIRVALGLLEHWEEIADGELLRVDCPGGKVTAGSVMVERRMRSTGEVKWASEPRFDMTTPSRQMGRYQPVPTIEYYLDLARYLARERKSHADDAQGPRRLRRRALVSGGKWSWG